MQIRYLLALLEDECVFDSELFLEVELELLIFFVEFVKVVNEFLFLSKENQFYVF